MNCQLNIFESLSTFLRKWPLRAFYLKFCPVCLGPRTWVLQSQPKNSMRMPVTNERAGVGTAVIRNRSCAIGRDDIGVEIYQTLARDCGRLRSHPMRGVAR
jgi:hypothetical protein